MTANKTVMKFSLAALALAAVGVAGAGPQRIAIPVPPAVPPPDAPVQVQPVPPARGARGGVMRGGGGPVVVRGGVAAPAAENQPQLQNGKVPTAAELGGADRFLSYVTTDKPIYRANEKVWVRAVLLNAATHQPLGNDQQANATVTILGPRGETVATGNAVAENSIVAFGWTVPEGIAGGEYTFKLTYPYQGWAPSERKFDVRIYRAPRLRNQITFAREGYGPGDRVTATVHSQRAEGGFPANAKVTIIARVDNQQVFTGPATIDAKGDCTANFELPKVMARGEGTLAFAIEDGGVVETATKTIPILLQTLDLTFYPEGGDAVAGIPNRFYLEAKTPAQKPADLVGEILDSKGAKVADVKTEHEGRARFSFTPAKGESYVLKVLEPAGIARTFALPATKDNGVVLESTANIAQAGEKINFSFRATTPGAYKITLKQREADVSQPAELTLTANALTANVGFEPRPEVAGVLTATVWNDKGEPLAERLIYRQPAQQVKVQVTPGQTSYVPGAKVTLNITTTDEDGKPIATSVGLTVTDDTVLEMLEKRDQAPRLTAMVYLEPEVQDLADAHVYLDPENPKSAIATDLLLGTQGWRRFALMSAEQFISANGDKAKRVLAFTKPEPPPPQIMAFAMGGGGGPGGGARRGGVRALAGAADMAAGMPEAVPMPRPAGIEENKAVNVNGAIRMDEELGRAKQLAAEAAVGQAVAAEPAQFAGDMPAAGGFGGGRGARGGRGAGIALDMVARRPMVIVQDPGPLLIVRQYAHELRPNWSPTDRTDFTETVYWNADVRTDDAGKATASFNLADSVTTFRIFADAFARTGALGSSSSTVQSIQPFFIEPKIPLEVTAGDVIELPISAVNNTIEDFKDFALTINAASGLRVTPPPPNPTLASQGRIRQIFKIEVGEITGELDLTINATAGAFVDKVTRKLRVKPKGFPTQLAYGGLVDGQTPVRKEFLVPNSVVPNSMTTFATVYPSPMANLTDAVAALLREPHGCFEQTSSTAYPLAMAQMYFVTHQGVDPQLAARGQELLTKGYQKLIAFECQDKGYEWFGGSAPGHEALTAYGLMEFRDMQAANLPVDDKMLERTRTWLIGRRGPEGGWQRNAKSLDSFGGAPELHTNAYITWALLQAGETSLDREISWVRQKARESQDSYVLALAANICNLAKDGENARYFMNQLVRKQTKDGQVEGAQTSITRSGGQALAVETTALATLAWLKERDFAANVQNSVKFLADSCKGGRFGSTQSTILALKAIVAYDEQSATPKADGKLVLMIDNNPWGEPMPFTVDSKGPITFSDFASKLAPGPHSVAIQMEGGSQMPFTMGVTYNSLTPSTDPMRKLDLRTWLKDAQMVEGGITEARVEVANNTEKDAATPIAIIGIPGGLEVRHDHLKELVKAGKISNYEVNGREVVLYWRQIKAGEKVDLSLSLVAGVPGMYVAPASRAYEYYSDEFKQWVEGSTVVITPK